MIERTEVDGRAATVCYLMAGFTPTDAASAELIKLIFDDGEIVFLQGRASTTDFNPYHEPAGSPEGGRFASGPGGGGGEPETYERGGGGGPSKAKAHPAHRLTMKALVEEAPAVKPNSVKVDQAARTFNERAATILKKDLGIDRLTAENRTEETDEYVAEAIAKDLENIVREGRAATTWYSEKLKEALKIAGEIHPEIDSGTNERFAFLAALAITSQGEVVDSNVRLTEVAYAHYKENGRYPTGMAVKDPAINKNFVKINTLLDRLGPEGVRELFSRQFTVRDLQKEMGMKVAKMGMDDLVYGSAVLGPKIGQGFYQNLNGNFKPITMDMWFMRSWGRMTGSGIGDADIEPLKERLRNALEAEGEKVPRTIAGLRAAADEIVTEHERAYAKYRAEFNSGTRKKTELVYAAERYMLNVDGAVVDAPRGAADRRWITQTFLKALDKLEARGIKLEPAEGQATWWSPEKQLFEKYGVRVREVVTDYAQTYARLKAEREKSK